jgi:hypothetical protein
MLGFHNISILVCPGLNGWKVSKHGQSPWELYRPEDLVILSPDAEQTLEDGFDLTKV